MKKMALLVLFILSACAGRPDGPRIALKANPSAIIAADLGFNRLAQEKGQWTAFRQTMATGAEMFVPQRASAAEFLKGKTDSASGLKWQPHQVWSSCDGTAGVTHGAWQNAAGLQGSFTTVWWRQSDGSYRWLLDSGMELPQPMKAPELIPAKVASCKGKAGAPISAPAVGADMKQGLSNDQSLMWISTVAPDNARSIEIMLWDGEKHVPVLTDIVPAPKG